MFIRSECILFLRAIICLNLIYKQERAYHGPFRLVADDSIDGGEGERLLIKTHPNVPSLRLLSHSHYNTPLRQKISWQTDNVITSGMISCFAICITQSTAYYICSVFVDQNPTDGNYCVSSSVGIFIMKNKKNILIWFLFINNKW